MKFFENADYSAHYPVSEIASVGAEYTREEAGWSFKRRFRRVKLRGGGAATILSSTFDEIEAAPIAFIPAERGTNILHYAANDMDPYVNRTPVLGWLISASGVPKPVTVNGPEDDAYLAATDRPVEMPDGKVYMRDADQTEFASTHDMVEKTRERLRRTEAASQWEAAELAFREARRALEAGPEENGGGGGHPELMEAFLDAVDAILALPAETVAQAIRHVELVTLTGERDVYRIDHLIEHAKRVAAGAR
jgi:hypothetical protein